MLFSRPSSPLKDRIRESAAQWLLTPTALADMSLADARVVVGFMEFSRVAAESVFIREGEVRGNDFMMLILDGDVAVESEAAAPANALVLSILGPGSLIGEMGVLDGSPRSATCTATCDLTVAVLSRQSLVRLIEKNPAVAARFLLAISKRLADRLREANRKTKTLGGLSRALQQELDVAHSRPSGLS